MEHIIKRKRVGALDEYRCDQCNVRLLVIPGDNDPDLIEFEETSCPGPDEADQEEGSCYDDNDYEDLWDDKRPKF